MDLRQSEEQSNRLEQFFKEHPSVALGFSGGVDSSFLLYAGVQYGAAVKAYFVKTVFQPAFELRDAYRLAGQIGAELTVLELDILADRQIAANPPDRCYYCKKAIFTALREKASADGISLLIDGTNASDDVTDRPGIRALTELSVRSPLRECGITKEEVRRLSRVAGLFTWDKPAYACLATRVSSGQIIEQEQLSKIERCEDRLHRLGFCNFRVRTKGDLARLQIRQGDIPLLAAQRSEVSGILLECFADAVLDLKHMRE